MAKKYYGVKKGHKPGVYSFEEAKKQVDGFSSAEWKGFNNHARAVEYVGLKKAPGPEKTGDKVFDDYFEDLAQHVEECRLNNLATQKQMRVMEQTRQKTDEIKKVETKIATIKAALSKAQGDVLKHTAALNEAEAEHRALTESIFDTHQEEYDTTYFIYQNMVFNNKEMAAREAAGKPGGIYIAHSEDGIAGVMEETGYTSYKEIFTEELNYVTEDGDKIYKIFVDGACSKNGTRDAVAGFGIYCGQDNPKNAASALPGPIQTNQRAELAAVKHAMTMLSGLRDNKKYQIFTDSAYVIGCLQEWVHTWRENGWKTETGAPVANADLIKEILDMSRKLIMKNLYGLQKVKAHSNSRDSNSRGNNEADRLAKMGVERGRELKEQGLI